MREAREDQGLTGRRMVDQKRDARGERLKASLRENLRRRKKQAHDRAEIPDPAAEPPPAREPDRR